MQLHSIAHNAYSVSKSYVVYLYLQSRLGVIYPFTVRVILLGVMERFQKHIVCFDNVIAQEICQGQV